MRVARLAAVLLGSSTAICMAPPALSLSQGSLPTATISAHRWIRRGKQSIAYQVATPVSTVPGAVPVVLLNGFGVGSFFFDRNLAAISMGASAQVYGVDYVGQASWDSSKTPFLNIIRV